ncbi:MAG: S9 family peptidase, partial [Pseudomonadota bacterium]
MARRIQLIIGCLVALAACTSEQDEATEMTLSYPDSSVVEQIDDYHGTAVPDPYRWLEDDVRENADVKRWVDAQNEVTFAYLADIEERAVIEKRLTALWDFERYGLPVKAGPRYFYTYNDGLQNQEVIYTLDALDDEPRMLIDPNGWSDDGTIALAAFFPSPDGRFLAYLVQDGGSDWREARVLDVETGEVMADQLSWLKFT